MLGKLEGLRGVEGVLHLPAPWSAPEADERSVDCEDDCEADGVRGGGGRLRNLDGDPIELELSFELGSTTSIPLGNRELEPELDEAIETGAPRPTSESGACRFWIKDANEVGEVPGIK